MWTITKKIIKCLVENYPATLEVVDRARKTCLWFADAPECCKTLLELKSNPNHKDRNGQSILFYAARDGKNDSIRELIEHKADVELQDLRSETALFYAVRTCTKSKCSEETCRLLVEEFHANVDHQNNSLKSPVAIAAAAKEEKLTALFSRFSVPKFTKGQKAPAPSGIAKVTRRATGTSATQASNILDTSEPSTGSRRAGKVADKGSPQKKLKQKAFADSDSTLVTAINECTASAVRELIDSGHSPTADADGLSLVFHAVSRKSEGSLEICKLLIEEQGLAAWDVNSEAQTPLFYAVRSGNMDCMKYLIQQRCDPQHEDEYGRTAIFEAVALDQPDCAAFLHEQGVNLFCRDCNGQTSLFEARRKCLEWLLSMKGDIEQRDSKGKTPLFAAARRGDVETVCTLLKARADVHVCDARQENCLFSAVVSKSMEVCRLLLEHHVDPTVTAQGQKKSVTPTDVARIHKLKWWDELVSKSKAQWEQRSKVISESTKQLPGAVASGSLQQVKSLVQSKADPKALDGNEGSLLFSLALRKERLGELSDFCKYLVDDLCLDVNFTDQHRRRTALFNAAAYGHYTVASYLLSKRCPIDHRDTSGQTALSLALEQNASKCAQLLIQRKASLKIQDKQGQTPLFCAVASGHAGMVSMALDAKADITHVDESGENCLFEARDARVVSLLLASRCDAQATNNQRQTALFFVAAEGLTEVINSLVAAAADVNHKDSTGQTPLFRALESDSTDAAVLLLTKHHASPSVEDEKGKTPLDLAKRLLKSSKRTEMLRLIESTLHIEKASRFHREQMVKGLFTAAHSGSIKQLNERIKAGVDPRLYMDVEGLSALSYAAMHEDGEEGDGDVKAMQMCELLIDTHGLSVSHTDILAQTPLFQAVKKCHSKTAALLLQKQSDCNVCDQNGQTALFFAAAKGKDGLDCLDLLLDKSDVKVVDQNGHTALFYASSTSCIETVKRLVGRGVSLQHKDKFGRTCIFSVQYAEMADALVKMKLDPNAPDNQGATPIFEAAFQGRDSVIKALVAARAQVDVLDNNKATALFWTNGPNSASCYRELLVAKCDPKSLDRFGQTALFHAAKYGNLECINILASHGVAPNLADTNLGQTALFYAASSANLKTCQLLVSLQADPNHVDDKGQSAMRWAKQANQKESAKFLQSCSRDKEDSNPASKVVPKKILRPSKGIKRKEPEPQEPMQREDRSVFFFRLVDESDKKIPFGTQEYLKAYRQLVASNPWILERTSRKRSDA